MRFTAVAHSRAVARPCVTMPLTVCWLPRSSWIHSLAATVWGHQAPSESSFGIWQSAAVMEDENV